MEFDKWIIFGCSPFINDIQDFSFAKNYKTIAINHFDKCKTNYRCAFDAETMLWIKKYNCLEKLILNAKSYGRLQGESVLKKQPLFYLKPHYLFEYSPRIILKKKNKLLGCRSSAIPAINYALLQGAKEIYLIGVDFNWNEGHYYSPVKYEKRQEDLLKLRQNIKQLRNYADIYRCNPNESLLLSFLPYKDIKDL